MLEKLRIAKYRFTIRAVERLELPPYKGSTLRGGFGTVFKKMACSQRGQQCASCLLRQTCAYAYVFETPVPPDAEVLRTYSDVPRPFVIEPPLDGKTVYEPGETLDFGFVLIGQGISYLPYFLLAFKELGSIGIGRGRKKFSLGDVYAVNPVAGREALLYSNADEGMRNENLSVGFAEIAESAQELPSDGLTVRFLTPTRLKHAGRYVERPEFHILFRNALRRLSSLYYFHCGERWDTDYKGLVDTAQGVVVIAEAETEWVDWERYSRRKGRRMDFGGFLGTVRYEGDLGPFLSVILVGELVHVGKACVFGNGRYEVGR